ncbi:MAG: hypothetical protein WC916_00685 [Candidatus Woesearchaeota archaeon]
MNKKELSDTVLIDDRTLKNIVGKLVFGYIAYQIGSVLGDYCAVVGAYVGLRANYYKMPTDQLFTMTFRTYDEEKKHDEEREQQKKNAP